MKPKFLLCLALMKIRPMMLVCVAAIVLSGCGAPDLFQSATPAAPRVELPPGTHMVLVASYKMSDKASEKLISHALHRHGIFTIGTSSGGWCDVHVDQHQAAEARRLLSKLSTSRNSFRVIYNSEIFEAAADGDLEKVKKLVNANPDLVNSKDNDGGPGLYRETALHMAALYDRTDIVKFLLANKADVDARSVDSKTPLYWAALTGHKDVAELLLANGADVNATGNDGEAPLHAAARNSRADMVKLLLANKADFNTKDNRGNTPLHYAAESFRTDTVALLLAKGADVNAKNNKGETPLFLTAFSRGHTDMIKLLLAKGADVNAKDNGGETPLHSAAVNGSVDVTTLLLANGADANAKDNRGRTPLDMTKGRSYSLQSKKWYDEVADLLRQHGGHE